MFFIEFVLFFTAWAGKQIEAVMEGKVDLSLLDTATISAVSSAMKLLIHFHTVRLVTYIEGPNYIIEEPNFEKAYRHIVRAWKNDTNIHIYWSSRCKNIHELLQDDTFDAYERLEDMGVHSIGTIFKKQPYGTIAKAIIDFHYSRKKHGLED